MNIFIIVVGLIIAISLHELGHAFAMRRYGIPIKEITLFGLGPTLATFRVSRFFGDTPVKIRLLPIGAFVMPTDQGAILERRLGYAERAHISGAGIIVNLALGCIILGIALPIIWNAGSLAVTATTFLIGLALATVLLLLRRTLSAYVLPLLGLLILGQLFWMVGINFFDPSQGVTVQDATAGPVGGVVYVSDYLAQNPGLGMAVLLAGTLSIAIGLSNCLPFYPFDGGHLMDNLIEKILGERYQKWETVVKTTLTVPGLLLILAVLLSDVSRFF